jgi:hypothetical protein
MKCISCGWPGLTWREARKAYGRMIRAGLTPDETKRHSPYCCRCATTLLRPIRSVSGVSGVSGSNPPFPTRALFDW